jgi:hypothetical protein
MTRRSGLRPARCDDTRASAYSSRDGASGSALAGPVLVADSKWALPSITARTLFLSALFPSDFFQVGWVGAHVALLRTTCADGRVLSAVAVGGAVVTAPHVRGRQDRIAFHRVTVGSGCRCGKVTPAIACVILGFPAAAKTDSGVRVRRTDGG